MGRNRSTKNRKSGQSLIELLVGVVVGSIMVIAAITIIAPALKSNTDVARAQVAIALGKELLENVRVFGEADWHNITNLATTSANHYYLRATSSPFTAASGDQSVTVSTTTYTRYFYVDEAYRDGGGSIAGSGTRDPSTMKITVAYSWPRGPTNTVSVYLTRSTRNKVFVQTDWSGGSGQEGPITVENYKFASSSSNMTHTSTVGSIKLSF